MKERERDQEREKERERLISKGSDLFPKCHHSLLVCLSHGDMCQTGQQRIQESNGEYFGVDNSIFHRMLRYYKAELIFLINTII